TEDNSSQNFVHTYDTAGLYTVNLTVSNINGTDSEVKTGYITVALSNQPPVADANGPYFGDESSFIIFNASNSTDLDGSIVSYEWDLDDDGEFDDGTGVTVTNTWSDDYSGNVSVRVTDDEGSTDIDTTTLTVNNVAPVVDAGPDQTVNVGEDVVFSGSFTDLGSLDTHTIFWDFGDGNTTEGTLTPVHTYAGSGVYYVILTVIDDDGASTSDTATVTVSDTTGSTMSVDSISISVIQKGKSYEAVATLKVLDENSNLVKGATVNGYFTLNTNNVISTVSGTTVGNGEARIGSGKFKANGGDVITFNVTGVDHPEYSYEPGMTSFKVSI
ncbi:PKD domain-containing protein, partial [Methanococcoides sp. LMO-2]